MRIPALIIASMGNGYRVLYKSKIFDSLKPTDFDMVCKRMDGFRFEDSEAYFITQSIGRMVIGKSSNIPLEDSEKKVKLVHCYFMNMNEFTDVIRGYRRQGAVIATFKGSFKGGFDESVEEITFKKKSSVQLDMDAADIRDTIISFGLAEGKRKYMFSEVDPDNALRVLLEFFPANFISEISVLTKGESDSNDVNVLFGSYNILSDNKVISIHSASQEIVNISLEINEFIKSEFKNAIVEIMEHVDRYDRGYLTELVSTVKTVSAFERSAIIDSNDIMRLMDKAQTIEGKMAIYGIILEMMNKIKKAQIINTDMLEKYWAFVLYTSVADNDRKNAALVHNICANHRIIDRDNYLRYVKKAIEMKYNEMDDDDLALMIIIAHEKPEDKTRLLNMPYDTRMAKAFMNNRLDLGARLSDIEDIMMDLLYM